MGIQESDTYSIAERIFSRGNSGLPDYVGLMYGQFGRQTLLMRLLLFTVCVSFWELP